jgi:hypothetical protein
MATYDYTEDLALARELITEFGRLVTAQRLSSAPADSNKPWKGPGTPTVDKTHKTTAAFVPASGADLGRFVQDKELLRRCEQVALLPGTGKVSVDLNDFHFLLDEKVTWKIEWVRELKPGPLSLLYVIGVKR